MRSTEIHCHLDYVQSFAHTVCIVQHVLPVQVQYPDHACFMLASSDSTDVNVQVQWECGGSFITGCLIQ